MRSGWSCVSISTWTYRYVRNQSVWKRRRSPPSGRNASLTPTIVLPSISSRFPFRPAASFNASAYVRLTVLPAPPVVSSTA